MDAQQFLAEFGHIANAPGGVVRLRELVLRLATEGKLVLQDPNDEHSLALYKRIQTEKSRLIAIGCIKREKPLSELKQSNLPYELPSSWSWQRLTDVFYSISPSSNKILSSKILDSGRFPVVDQGKRYIAGYIDEEDLVINIPGSVIVFGDHTTELKLIDFDFVAGADGVKILRPILLNERYFYWYLKTIKIENKGYSRHYKILTSNLFPLPPIEEQSRIVAKADELMALCDKLESQQQAIRTIQNNLRLASLQAVASAASPNELNSAWQKVSTIFSSLFTKTEDVSDLRNLVLDLAVHGLLVEQNQSEEPTEQWLARVKEHKHNLLKAKQIAKQSHVPPVTEDEHPFSLPKGWAYVRLGEITNKIGSGSTPRGGREVYVKEGIPFLRSQNVRNDGLKLGDVVYITSEEHERMSNTAVQANDILLNITGASLGRSALVPSDFSEANVSQHVTIIRLTDPEVRFYLHLCILSPYTQAMIWGRQVGMAREGLSKKVLEQFEIPMPPVAEQKRIVKRVAELMRLCDVLEQQLHDANNLAQKLSVTSVSAITGIRTEEEEALKTPKTELISKLRLVNNPDIKEQAPLAAILARHHDEMPAGDLWQRYGGDIDTFYAQLKLEVGKGWIEEPAIAEMRETEAG